MIIIILLTLTSVKEEDSGHRYEMETSIELGVDDYIEKPFSRDILLKRVEKFIKRKVKSQT